MLEIYRPSKVEEDNLLLVMKQPDNRINRLPFFGMDNFIGNSGPSYLLSRDLVPTNYFLLSLV